MKVNYNKISKVYDDVREEEVQVIQTILSQVKLNQNSLILDIGCGTGNYTNIIQRLTCSKVYGLDQSEGMLEKAKEKNRWITYVLASAMDTPFDKEYFDLIYMTDVIHHISNLTQLFFELNRILKLNGKICILTQSHRQIELRPTTYYFPETCDVDKQRYPEIEKIITEANNNNLNFIKEDIIDDGIEMEINEHYLDLIEKKGYSMLHLISDKCYQNGLEKLKKDISKGLSKIKTAGNTLLWFKKLS